MEEYLTVKELIERIKMAPQTIYNKISSKKRKEFLPQIHYVKISRKKILFKWSAILQWMERPMLENESKREIPLKETKPIVLDELEEAALKEEPSPSINRIRI